MLSMPLPRPQALLDNNLVGFARIANASGLTPALNSTVLRATIFAPTDEVRRRMWGLADAFAVARCSLSIHEFWIPAQASAALAALLS